MLRKLLKVPKFSATEAVVQVASISSVVVQFQPPQLHTKVTIWSSFGYKPPFLPVPPKFIEVATVDDYLQQRQEILQQLKKDLAMARNRMKQQVDKGRSEREFSVGELVYLKLRISVPKTKTNASEGCDSRGNH